MKQNLLDNYSGTKDKSQISHQTWRLAKFPEYEEMVKTLLFKYYVENKYLTDEELSDLAFIFDEFNRVKHLGGYRFDRDDADALVVLLVYKGKLKYKSDTTNQQMINQYQMLKQNHDYYPNFRTEFELKMDTQDILDKEAKNNIKEALNLAKKRQKSQSIKDMGDYYLVDIDRLTNEINDEIEKLSGTVFISYDDINESLDNSLRLDFNFSNEDPYPGLIVDFIFKTLPRLLGTYVEIYNINEDLIIDDGESVFCNLNVTYDKPLRDNSVNLNECKPILQKHIFSNRKELKETLIQKHKINPLVIDTLFKQKPSNIAESLLSVLDKPTITQIMSEMNFKCSIDDVEKRAKKIVFVKYNWDPSNVVFNTENDAVQIIAVEDLKLEYQQPESDEIVLNYLATLSKAYTKDLNNEFTGICSKIKLLSKYTSDITSSVYCYTIVKLNNQYVFFSSNGEKKLLKKANNPQYLPNKLYFKIGLFASNVK